MSDFAFNKKEKSRGVYGKRTTLYDNYEFDIKKDQNSMMKKSTVTMKIFMTKMIHFGKKTDWKF